MKQDRAPRPDREIANNIAFVMADVNRILAPFRDQAVLLRNPNKSARCLTPGVFVTLLIHVFRIKRLISAAALSEAYAPSEWATML